MDFPLLGVKYLLLGFFCYIILWGMDVRSIEAFLYSRYNLVVDARMLLFFLHPSTLTLQVMAVLLLFQLVVRNCWCRYLCPYGALLGLEHCSSILQVKRDPSLCINCRECERVCRLQYEFLKLHNTPRRVCRMRGMCGSLSERGCLVLKAPFKSGFLYMPLPLPSSSFRPLVADCTANRALAYRSPAWRISNVYTRQPRLQLTHDPDESAPWSAAACCRTPKRPLGAVH